jgi:hypothetical protein
LIFAEAALTFFLEGPTLRFGRSVGRSVSKYDQTPEMLHLHINCALSNSRMDGQKQPLKHQFHRQFTPKLCFSRAFDLMGKMWSTKK